MEKNIEYGGVIVIDKPKGITSHDVVFKVRKLFMTKKVGHTGTLDPLATGVLPVMVGRAVKASEYLLCDDKKYIADIKLGITTDTEDITGKIISEASTIPSEEEFVSVLPSFVGKIKQIPPMYSALKVNGQKLCDLARQGLEIERAPREIEIFAIDYLGKNADGTFKLVVECSKGTYIRTLCTDIGAKLSCGAVMSGLRRVKSGHFEIEKAYTLEKLEKMSIDERINLLLDTEELFSELEAIVLPDFYEKICRSGCEIYQKKIGTNFPLGTKLRLKDKTGNFYGLGEVMEFENGLAIKAVKQFIV